jgi:hypothetical protein
MGVLSHNRQRGGTVQVSSSKILAVARVGRIDEWHLEIRDAFAMPCC